MYLSKAKIRGVTLIELMIAVAIVGILAAVAYPSYTDFVVKSNRAEAQQQLMAIANLQEQYFVDSYKYSADMKKLGLDADPFVTESGNYSIDATINGSTYLLKATAQGAQASRDSSCKEMSITETGKKSATSTTCWEK